MALHVGRRARRALALGRPHGARLFGMRTVRGFSRNQKHDCQQDRCCITGKHIYSAHILNCLNRNKRV